MGKNFITWNQLMKNPDSRIVNRADFENVAYVANILDISK